MKKKKRMTPGKIERVVGKKVNEKQMVGKTVRELDQGEVFMARGSKRPIR